MQDPKIQNRKTHYARMKSEDFRALVSILFEEPRPLVQYKILDQTRRIPQ